MDWIRGAAEHRLERQLRRLMLRTDRSRSPGLHLSDVIKDILRRTDPKRFGEEPAVEFIGLGNAWDHYLATLLSGSGERPGEFRREGIICTPDWWDWTDDILEEWKLAWSSNREHGIDHPGLARYHMQGKFYCHCLGAREIRFRIGWVNADYRPPQPSLEIFRVRYSDEEVLENAELIVQHAHDMGRL